MSIRAEVMDLLRQRLRGRGAWADDHEGHSKAAKKGWKTRRLKKSGQPKLKLKKPKGGDLVQGGRSRKAAAKRNPWIAHVKRYAKQHGISYGQALTEAGASYRSGSGYIPVGGGKKRSGMRKKRGGVPLGGRRDKIMELAKILNTVI